jgi:hypothetical protein
VSNASFTLLFPLTSCNTAVIPVMFDVMFDKNTGENATLISDQLAVALYCEMSRSYSSTL